MKFLKIESFDDLRNFYLRWYGPNNAILTISGDVTAKEVIPLVNKYFGSAVNGRYNIWQNLDCCAVMVQLSATMI